jgi:hypothetical protein
MQVTLTIIRYPPRYAFFGLLAMAVHRFPLWFNKNISFFKLLGCGKNGSFDMHPDWQQFGIFAVNNQPGVDPVNGGQHLINELYGPLVEKWIRFFHCETWTIFLEPLEGHGTWDRKQPFGPLTAVKSCDGPIATLTRATIRFSKLKAFWETVDSVAAQVATADGFISSLSIGEIPLIKQATFSVWQSSTAMKTFAYQMQEHVDVIRKTRKDNWYSEELFVRFKPLMTVGTIKGHDPLAGKL